MADIYVPRTPKDFRNFLYLAWHFLRLPDPTELQYDIAYYLQHGPPRRIIEAFRGEGKSWITSAYVCHYLDHYPQENVSVVSASKGRADDFSTFTQRLIREMPLLQHLQPKEGQRDSKISFDVGPSRASHAPSVKSSGITGQLTGGRAGLIIADDVEIPNNSMTQTMRDKLSEQVKEFDSMLKPTYAPGGGVVFLGTPQNEQTIYNKLLERGYKMRIWPSRFPTADERKDYDDRLAPMIADRLDADPDLAGKPTDPARFSDLDLREREASYGRAGYALQFQLRTNLSDAEKYPLKVRDLIILACADSDVAPEKVVWATSPDLVINDLPNMAMAGDRFHRPMAVVGNFVPWAGSVMSIDPSGRGKDELAYAVVKKLSAFLYVTACGGMRGGYSEENLIKLATIAKAQKVNWLRIEENFGDGMFTALLKPHLERIYPVTCEEIKHSKQKELRIIDTLEPVMSSHKLVVDPKVIEDDYNTVKDLPTEAQHQYSLIYQMTRITRDRGALAHDDRLDALAMAVAYWAEQMNMDADKDKQARDEAALQAELATFMDQVLGGNRSQAGNLWMKV